MQGEVLQVSRRRAALWALLPFVWQTSRAGPDEEIVAARRSRLRDAMTNMKANHEIVPFGIEIKGGWHVGPYVVMGTEPYGRAIPLWWRRGVRHAEWRSLAPWFTVYLDAKGSSSTNTGVEIDGIEAWALVDSTMTWQLLRSMRQPAWQGAYHPNAVQSFRASGGRMLSGGSFLATPTRSFMVHGGSGQVALPWTNKPDFSALLVSVRHRLALIDPNGPDDRYLAGMGVLAGADYYPWVGAGLADLSADYNPGAGSGRFLRAEQTWRYSTVLLASKQMQNETIASLPPPAFVY